ncbi:hypothetical protein RJ641_020719 [Dillenia turbinata]|uniref:Uncharacterized protein n=1 Tax=Dillenia turbinata TaxID=194707 RepID=A0AAN8YWM1_9MAGN
MKTEGDHWATRGGLEKIDCSKAPFVASYTSFHVDGCDALTPLKDPDLQYTWQSWDQRAFLDLHGPQYGRLQWLRNKFTIFFSAACRYHRSNFG